MSGVDEFEDLETWKKPEDKTFDNWMDSRIARFETRTYDWDALKFQANFDPKYARSFGGPPIRQSKTRKKR